MLVPVASRRLLTGDGVRYVDWWMGEHVGGWVSVCMGGMGLTYWAMSQTNRLGRGCSHALGSLGEGVLVPLPSRLLLTGFGVWQTGAGFFSRRDGKNVLLMNLVSLPRCKLQQICRYSANRFARLSGFNERLSAPEYLTPFSTPPAVQNT